MRLQKNLLLGLLTTGLLLFAQNPAAAALFGLVSERSVSLLAAGATNCWIQ